MSSLRDSLKDAVRKLAYKTSVDQLKKDGVKKVNVLGIDRVVSLIDEAVNRSLRSRMLLGEREAVIDATREEFLRLLRSNEELKQQHSRAEEETFALQQEIQRLQLEMQTRVEEVEADRRIEVEGENTEIATRLRELFASGMRGEVLQGRVMELILTFVDRERHAVAEAEAAARDRDVGLLQRRIAKLSESLEQTESQLASVSSRVEGDTGLASIYREVQGLSSVDPERERKKELMASLFEANRRLQKKA